MNIPRFSIRSSNKIVIYVTVNLMLWGHPCVLHTVSRQMEFLFINLTEKMTCALDFGYSEMSQSPCCGELLCGFEQEKKLKGGSVQYRTMHILYFTERHGPEQECMATGRRI